MRRSVAGVLLIVGVAMGLVSGIGAADAAPRPSARVCAVSEDGKPYVGPVDLYSRKRLVRTLNTSPRGCMIFKGLHGGFAYKAGVYRRTNTCSTMRDSKSMPIGRSGFTRTTRGESAWKVAPRSNGQVDLGRFVVRQRTSMC